MGWTKNGESAGTSGQGLAIEAYQVLLIKKGDDAPGDTEYHYRETKWVTDEYGNQYLYDIFGNKVTGSITISGTTRYFGPTGIYLVFNKLKVIDISAHQGKN